MLSPDVKMSEKTKELERGSCLDMSQIINSSQLEAEPRSSGGACCSQFVTDECDSRLSMMWLIPSAPRAQVSRFMPKKINPLNDHTEFNKQL